MSQITFIRNIKCLIIQYFGCAGYDLSAFARNIKGGIVVELRVTEYVSLVSFDHLSGNNLTFAVRGVWIGFVPCRKVKGIECDPYRKHYYNQQKQLLLA